MLRPFAAFVVNCPYISCIMLVTTSRCDSVNFPLEEKMPLFLPRSIVSVVMPTLSSKPFTASLPPTTPIQPGNRPRRPKTLLPPHRDVIPAARRHVAHARHKRLLEHLRLMPYE